MASRGHSGGLAASTVAAAAVMDAAGFGLIFIETVGTGQSEDDLAFLRDEREFRNLRIVELPNGDFAHTVVRQLLFSTYQLGLYDQLQHSTDDDLAATAAKAVKEVAYHRDHAVKWTLRLGDGTRLSEEVALQEVVDGRNGVRPGVGRRLGHGGDVGHVGGQLGQDRQPAHRADAADHAAAGRADGGSRCRPGSASGRRWLERRAECPTRCRHQAAQAGSGRAAAAR